jgi:hypothetical protein
MLSHNSSPENFSSAAQRIIYLHLEQKSSVESLIDGNQVDQKSGQKAVYSSELKVHINKNNKAIPLCIQCKNTSIWESKPEHFKQQNNNHLGTRFNKIK